MIVITACLCLVLLRMVQTRIYPRVFPAATPIPQGVWLEAPLNRQGDYLHYCCTDLSWQQNVSTANLCTLLNGQNVPLQWDGFNEGDSIWRIPNGVKNTYPDWDSGGWTVRFFWDYDFGPLPRGSTTASTCR